MWPPAAQRSATTGIYTPERSDGPDLAALRRDWPRYDDWHREGIASDATMPPLGEGEPWMPATYLERLRRQYMVHLHDGGAPSDIEAAQGLLHALRALGPKEPAVALVPAPRDPAAARAAFEAEGYLYYPPGEVLGRAELGELQRRFAQEEPLARQRWREELRAAGAEGLGHTGDRMISVGDTEEWFASSGGLLHACMGASLLPATLEAIFGGAAVCRGAGARVLPPEQPVVGAGPMGAPQGYVSWHRGQYSSSLCAFFPPQQEEASEETARTDWHESDGESRGDPRPDLKLLINVEDVASIDQAPTAIVPGDCPPARAVCTSGSDP